MQEAVFPLCRQGGADADGDVEEGVTRRNADDKGRGISEIWWIRI